MTALTDACRRIVERGTKPTLPEVRPLVDAYYALPGNGAGGSLHVVLDDNNVERRFIESGIEHARERDDLDGEWLARVLLLLSPSQRRRL